MIDSPPSMYYALLQALFLSVGVAMGSFGNVIISRVPSYSSIMGRSRCPCCLRTLKAVELIPIFSFIFLRGRCGGCKEGISFQYPLVEILSALLFLFALFYTEFVVLHAIFLAPCLWLLLLISVIDMHTKSIPDVLNISFVGLAIFYAILTQQFVLWAPLAAAGFFGIQWAVSNGRWVGSGDIILAAGIGALVGGLWETLIAISIAYMLGAIYAAYVLISQHGKTDANTHIAFGPFLALGGIITLLYGERILTLFFI